MALESNQKAEPIASFRHSSSEGGCPLFRSVSSVHARCGPVGLSFQLGVRILRPPSLCKRPPKRPTAEDFASQMFGWWDSRVQAIVLSGKSGPFSFGGSAVGISVQIRENDRGFSKTVSI